MSLFVYEPFISHSGKALNFKIECDALTKLDYQSLADLIAKQIKFKQVIGVPRGGIVFEECLAKYQDDKSNIALIVDDVLTTGKSMNEAKQKLINQGYHADKIKGIVVFARTQSPDWIKPIFQFSNLFAKYA